VSTITVMLTARNVEALSVVGIYADGN